MLRDWAAMAALVIVVAGCSFEIRATGDGGTVEPDSPLLPTVGFAQAASTEDESSGTVMVEVTLSPGALGPVTVAYSFGGDAIEGTDYTTSTGTLAFAIGETTKSIPLVIIADQEAEADEIIVISLVSPIGAKLGIERHTITIGANTLPRVNLSAASSMTDEETAVTITITLDKMANGPSSVTYTVGGGTAQAAGTFADYALASGVVNFPTGSTMQTLPLGVIGNLRNELDETLNITLTTSTGIVLGTTPLQTHTILNNDAVPSVFFSPATATVVEGDTGPTPVMLNVTLSAASGRTVIVPFAVNAAGTSMTDPSDYTLVGSSVTFLEGETTKSLTVNVVADVINEPTEVLALGLAAPADLSATLGATPIGQLTITDDDPSCVGVLPYRVCYSTPPAGPVTLPLLIDTGTSLLCEGNQPQQWTATGQQNQPTACVIRGTTITQTGITNVTGTRPLVLAANGAVTIDTLDVASHRGGTLGPGATTQAASCITGAQLPGLGGGGAGGSFLSIGGDGGLGVGGTAPGRAANQVTAPATLRAGCHGQQGDGGDETGKAGGVVYIVAGGTLTITGGINASGSSAVGGAILSGGSGAGSGGMIVLYAAAISATGAAVIANGAGGASGGDVNSTARDGTDPILTSPTTPASGGAGGGTGGAGGAGWAGMTAAVDGLGTGNPTEGGGGGGGGGGYLRSNVAISGATTSAGRIDIIP